MPTYEYRCKECGHEFEAQQSFSDASLTECPTCGGVLRKVFGNVGITFKGSGFYKTDSRAGSNGAKKDGAKKDTDKSSTNGDGPSKKESSSPSESSSGSKSDSGSSSSKSDSSSKSAAASA